MKNSLHISLNQKINAFLLIVIVNACQIGVGIHGFQRVVYQDAKQDAWIAVILSFIYAHFVAFIMIKTLKMFQDQDLYGIHQMIFGKYFGNFLNSLYVLYCSFAFVSIIINYKEVINTWVFPHLASSFLYISLLIIVIYTFTGGFRIIIGISTINFLFTLAIPIILLVPLKYANINSLLPILDNDMINLLKGVYSMTFTIAGFELINFIYPNVKEKSKVGKYVHIGLLTTLFVYLTTMLIALTYFNGEQLNKLIWATLSMLSMIKLPFFERIEILIICGWMIIILPNLCIYLWAAYRGVIRIKSISPNKFVWSFSIVIFILTLFINTRSQIEMVNNIFSKIAFIIVFIYPFILFIFALIKKLFTKRKVQNDETI
ncbi:GerAB/ArcD/ProY family transporter [Lysinibacillus telephonicus]|uniref:Spore gernimation protein n=2 Tax=Lysinibacillus telephonicus TaxID=1714840 RepID=A0A431UPI5_9BACI|nr:GerAB/ArcD/ProY family transporter [Lysinibacillus telephonicus]RTQ91905.1 spore gernimation protein [Lysinibacillus telephonicus]